MGGGGGEEWGQGVARKKLEFEITCDITLCNCRGEFFKAWEDLM